MLSVCRSLRRLLAGSTVILLSPIAALADVPVEQKLQQVLTDFAEEHPEIPGIMVRLKSDEMHLDWRGAAGVADRESRIPIRPDQPARLASTTKTYVAAAILRLAEQQKLKLDDPIERHLSQSLNETIAFMTRVTDPLAPPGTQYLYSDGGYILLGEIVRQVSGTSLATAVRELLRFDELGLRATWWEVMEADPADLEPRISQYLFDANTRDCNPSFDLYGGGGLVATMPDVAKFYESLFAGRVLRQPRDARNDADAVDSRARRPVRRRAWPRALPVLPWHLRERARRLHDLQPPRCLGYGRRLRPGTRPLVRSVDIHARHGWRAKYAPAPAHRRPGRVTRSARRNE